LFGVQELRLNRGAWRCLPLKAPSLIEGNTSAKLLAGAISSVSRGSARRDECE
jgi:hypothetical protein